MFHVHAFTPSFIVELISSLYHVSGSIKEEIKYWFILVCKCDCTSQVKSMSLGFR